MRDGAAGARAPLPAPRQPASRPPTATPSTSTAPSRAATARPGRSPRMSTGSSAGHRRRAGLRCAPRPCRARIQAGCTPSCRWRPAPPSGRAPAAPETSGRAAGHDCGVGRRARTHQLPGRLTPYRVAPRRAHHHVLIPGPRGVCALPPPAEDQERAAAVVWRVLRIGQPTAVRAELRAPSASARDAADFAGGLEVDDVELAAGHVGDPAQAAHGARARRRRRGHGGTGDRRGRRRARGAADRDRDSRRTEKRRDAREPTAPDYVHTAILRHTSAV